MSLSAEMKEQIACVWNNRNERVIGGIGGGMTLYEYYLSTGGLHGRSLSEYLLEVHILFGFHFGVDGHPLFTPSDEEIATILAQFEHYLQCPDGDNGHTCPDDGSCCSYEGCCNNDDENEKDEHVPNAKPVSDAEQINQQFNTAAIAPFASPLILDLDGDGLETYGANTSEVRFDHDGDGLKYTTGWVGADDGLLVFDRNGDGLINDGTELFGDHTLKYDGSGEACANGFEALAQEDTNSDGVIDENDANWASLRVWRDLNQDGVTDEGELFTLGELGITSLNTAYAPNGTAQANGNTI